MINEVNIVFAPPLTIVKKISAKTARVEIARFAIDAVELCDYLCPP